MQYLKRFIPVIKNCKYFKKNYEYLYNDDKVKPLHTMPPKSSTYVKSYDEQIKWMCKRVCGIYLFTLYLTLTYKLKIHTFISKLKF